MSFGVPSRRGSRRSSAILLGLLCCGVAAGQEEPIRPEEPLEEHVEVQLFEIRFTATDKRGRPVTDLRPEEITVLEGGEPQELAYLDLLAQGGRDLAASKDAPPPAPLYDAQGVTPSSAEAVAVAPPRPVRRIVFVFDPLNSKLRVREEWKSATLYWIRSRMRPEDQVAIVAFRRYIDWVQGFTSNRDGLLRTVENVDLLTGFPNRDRRDDVSRLVDDLLRCADVTDSTRSGGRKGGAESTYARTGSAEVDCAAPVAQSYIKEWATESEESLAQLRTLTGQLAAVGGRKEVILFSEGMVADAAATAVNVMMGVYGPTKVDLLNLTSRMADNSLDEITRLHVGARAADVVFFTLDTRTGAERGYFENIERSNLVQDKTLGINPWNEMYEATSSTLAALANESGGRAFYGLDDLAADVRRAADAFFGIYTLGYYRSDPDREIGKIRLKVRRKGVKLDYHEKSFRRSAAPMSAKLDISIGRPEPTADGDRQWLPIRLELPLGQIPLRRGGGGYGCQLGIFLQAVRPDGTIAAEAFDQVTVAVDKATRSDEDAGTYRHETGLALPPGPYRLQARLSDDRQEIAGSRAVDITLSPGEVRAGLSSPEATADESP